MKQIERKVYFKLQFSMGKITEEETAWVRESMDKLEKEPVVMRCFQNTSQSTFARHGAFLGTDPDFSIYYRDENIESINKFLFKVQLKFPNFKLEKTQTLQEHF